MYRYKDFEIGISRDGQIVCDQLNIVQDSVTDVKKAIDAVLRQNIKNKKPVIFLDFARSTIVAGIATRISGNRYSVKIGYNKRVKMTSDDLYLDTPKNREILERYARMAKYSSRISARAFEILDTVETLDESE